MKKKKKRFTLWKKGFTLVELLATIVVIALLFSIVMFLTTNAINKSKNNTYKVTIKEIEKNANSYLMENNNRLSFIYDEDKGYEYQCVTVENLIDYGYLDKNVINSLVDKDTSVLRSDYVYIQRDNITKAITKTIYVNKSNEELYTLCGGAIIAQKESVITFIASPGFNEWSTYKDVTIIYNLKNINDVRTAKDYTYNHRYTGNNQYDSNNDTLDNVTKTKKIRVLDNGTMDASIYLGDKYIADATKEINRVDIIGPVVTNKYSGNKIVSRSVTIPLKVTDFGIGVDYKTFTKEDIKIKVGEHDITDYTLEQVSEEDYKLVINNTVYDGKLVITIDKDTIFDKLNNGNLDISIDTDIEFNNIYCIINNEVIITVDSQTGTTITGKTQTSTIYVDPYN